MNSVADKLELMRETGINERLIVVFDRGAYDGKLLKEHSDRILKFALGIALIPIFYILSKVFKVSTDWILSLFSNQDFLVLPVTIIFFTILSMIFVELIFSLISGRKNYIWALEIKKIVVKTGNDFIKICKGLIESFLRLLKFIPDFFFALEIMLLDIEEVKDESSNNAADSDANKKMFSEEV